MEQFVRQCLRRWVKSSANPCAKTGRKIHSTDERSHACLRCTTERGHHHAVKRGSSAWAWFLAVAYPAVLMRLAVYSTSPPPSFQSWNLPRLNTLV